MAENWSIRKKRMLFGLFPLPSSPGSCLDISTMAGTSAATGMLWWPLHGQLVPPRAALLMMTTAEQELHSLTLLASAGLSATSDPSVPMIRFDKLQDGSFIMYLGWLVFDGLVSRIGSVRWDQLDLLQVIEGREQFCQTAPLVTAIRPSCVTQPHLHSEFVNREKGYLTMWISLLPL